MNVAETGAVAVGTEQRAVATAFGIHSAPNSQPGVRQIAATAERLTDEEAVVLGLHSRHRILHISRRDVATSEVGRHGQVLPIPGVGRSHHIRWLKDGRHKVMDRMALEGLGGCAGGGERRIADCEEVKTREGDHVGAELTKVAVELAWEAERGGDTAHDVGNEGVEVRVGGILLAEGLQGKGEQASQRRPKTATDLLQDLVERLVVQTEGEIDGLDELQEQNGVSRRSARGERPETRLVEREHGVVGLDDRFGNLW